MRRSIQLLVAVAAAGALGVAAAVADKGGSASVRPVAATFTATASNARTTTCAGLNGAVFHVTRATFSGTSTSTEPALNGTVRVRLRMVVGPTGDGMATGSFRVRSATNGGASANLTAVVSNNASLKGFLRGKVGGGENREGRRNRGNEARAGTLLANFSATTQAAAQGRSTLTGELGGTPAGKDAAVVFTGSCGEDDGD